MKKLITSLIILAILAVVAIWVFNSIVGTLVAIVLRFVAAVFVGAMVVMIIRGRRGSDRTGASDGR